MRAFKEFFKTNVGMKASSECAPCDVVKEADGLTMDQGGVNSLKGAFGGSPKPPPPPPPPTPSPAPTGGLGSIIAGGLKRFSGR